MNVYGRFITLQERAGSFTRRLGLDTALLYQSGALWEHTEEQSNSTFTYKIEDTAQLNLLMCSKSAELQSQPFPFPLRHQMFGVYILIPREQSAVLEFLSVQHYRVHLTTSCSAFILLQPCPPFLKFTIIFPLVFVSKSEKTHPSQPKGTHLSAPGVWGLLL